MDDTHSIADSFTIVARRASRFFPDSKSPHTQVSVAPQEDSDAVQIVPVESGTSQGGEDAAAMKRTSYKVRRWVRTRLWRRSN